MDKIEKIRQEIERLKKQEKENEKAELMSDSWILGRQVMLEHFEHFLNTLSEEPDKSLEEAAETHVKNKYSLTKLLGAEIREAVNDFIAGAEWQEEQDMDEWIKDRDGCFWDGVNEGKKDTIERAIAWLKEHANEYIVDLTPTYPDAPANIIVGGMCWEHLRKAMEDKK